MKTIFLLLVFGCFTSCQTPKLLTKKPNAEKKMTGSAFYKQVAKYTLGEREALADSLILSGNIPHFLIKMKRINVSIFDSVHQKNVQAHYYVTPDYLSIGTNENFARLPLSPMSAQRMADSFHCFLPTRKIVNDIFTQAKIKLEPQPLFAFRDSAPTFYHHHLIIEGQRQLKKGLIAGIKKDIVISSKITHDIRPNRVAIYGWHKLDGQPIQPLYVGHVNGYVDYSHGIRLVHRTIWVDGKPMDYTDVLKHPVFRQLICDEAECGFYRY